MRGLDEKAFGKITKTRCLILGFFYIYGNCKYHRKQTYLEQKERIITDMEFTQRYLPMEWEEQWRKEKERKKKVFEEGGEGMEQDNRELRKIVAYNDSRMGLINEWTNNDVSKVRMSGTSHKLTRGLTNDGAFGEEGYNVHICCSKNFSENMFVTLKYFYDSSLLTDLTLTTDNGSSFHVHSVVLAAVSTFILERLKEESSKQSNDTHVERVTWSVSMGTEVDRIGLQAVIEFAYSGHVSSLNKDTVTQIKTAAQVLEVPQLVDLCNETVSKQEQPTVPAEEHLRSTLQSIEQLWADKVGFDVTLDVDGNQFHG